MNRELISRGVNVTLHTRVRKPAEMILSVTDEDKVSLITMSAFGTDRFRELLLGSSTFTVVRKTKKPVLIIQTGQDRKNR